MIIFVYKTIVDTYIAHKLDAAPSREAYYIKDKKFGTLLRASHFKNKRHLMCELKKHYVVYSKSSHGDSTMYFKVKDRFE